MTNPPADGEWSFIIAWTELWLCAAVFMIAGCVQGASGFGFGLVSVALLGLVLADPKQATILPLLPNLVVTAWILARVYRHVDWPSTTPFILASLLAVPLGAVGLAAIPEQAVRLGLAGVLLVSGAYGLIPRLSRYPWHRLWLGVPCGLTSGALSGAFNVGGPPAIAFFHNRNLPKQRFIASLQLVFCTSAIVRLMALTATGLMSWSIVWISLSTGLFAIVGGGMGLIMLRRIPQHRQRLGVSIAQIGLAMIYLFK